MTPRQQAILVGALVTGVLSTSYLGLINILCCAGVIAGGVVAAQQYASKTSMPLNSGDGAVLGAWAGAGGAVLASVFDRMLRPFGLDSQGMMEGMMPNMEQREGMSPEMMEQFQGGEASMLMLLVGLVVTIVLYAIFGALGGAIGASLFGDDGRDGGGVQTAEAEVVE